MKRILFLHDTDLSLRRGAELTLKQLIGLGQNKGFDVAFDALSHWPDTKNAIDAADLTVLSSSSRCRFEKRLIRYLTDEKQTYAKLEFDHNFCVRRTIYCTVDRNRYQNCCDPEKFHLYRDLFANSRMNFFQSPKHYENHRDFYGEAVKIHQLMPPTVEVENLRDNPEKDENTIPYFGELSLLKGGHEFIDYASENPQKRFEVYGTNKLQREIPANVHFMESVDNARVLEILGKSKYFFCKPYWPEPSGRLAAEAFLSGCEIISNDRVGTFSYDFYPNDKARAIREMEETPDKFWETLSVILDSEKAGTPSLGNVLVLKSYGGLGDIFFIIPSLFVLKAVSDSVTFAVEPRLLQFFADNVPEIRFIDKNTVPFTRSDYDQVIELGNCPAFGRAEFPEQLHYTTHKKVRQHAMGHYADAVAKFHPDAPQMASFPYFKRDVNWETPYFTMHPGAGFQLKTWPIEYYASLILELRNFFPNLRCKVIVGPGDPNPLDHIATKQDQVDIISGGIGEVGEVMSGALFHIGNDAGITHVAGAYNVPSVGIYGPTGPGAWGCLSEQTEIVWGKPGRCDLKCTYEVILACEHRNCLTMTKTSQVLGAVFRLLEKTYPEFRAKKIINPALEVAFSETGCKLEMGNASFEVHFTDEMAPSEVRRILSGDFSHEGSSELKPFMEFLSEQKMIVSVPEFPNHRP